MKKTLTLLMCALAVLSAKAQQTDDKLKYTFSYAKTSPANGGGLFVDDKISLNFPTKTGTKSTFTIGPDLGMLNISGTGTEADASSLGTVGLSFGFHTIVGNKTIFSAHAEPLLASDFGGLSAQDLRFKSEAMFLFNTDHRFAYGFGLGYQYQFSGSQLLPLIFVIWHISDNVTLSGPLPLIPRLDFKLNQQWSIGLGINGDYSSYRLNNFNNDYIQYRNFAFGFTGKYKPSKRLELNAFLGGGNRTISVYDKNESIPLSIFSWEIGGGSHTPLLEQKFKGAALNLGLSYKID